MAIEIRLLGQLEVLRDGRVVSLPSSKKTRALLGYLVATNRTHPRADLCDMFWEGPDDPRGALRWSLSKLRAIMDEESEQFLITDNHQAAFDVSKADVDLFTLRTHAGPDLTRVRAEVLKRSTGLFRGEFLDGLDLPDCYRYHEWWIAERESIRALRIAILAALVERLRETPDAALVYARARLLIDPFSEDAHIDAIRLLGRSGRVREGLQQYESCCRMLEGQLGAKPSIALERVRSALGSESLSATDKTDRVSPLSSAMLPRPLVGRRAECKQIEEAVTSACRGGNHPVLWITGEPGIGKTRLLEEVSAQIRAVKGLVLKGRAYEAEMVCPCGPWIDALGSTDIKFADPSLSDRNRLFDAVARFIADLTESRPVALILDDVQWFDEVSVALLHFVSRALPDSRLLIACAARSGEVAGNAAVGSLLRALRREERLNHLEIDRLDAASVRELIQGIGANVDAGRVFVESEGNALFAIEIAQALARGDAVLPGTIEGLIVDRLGQIDERARDLVPWAAAFGRSFNPETLRLASGLAPAELVAAMKELEVRGVIRPSLSSSMDYDFTHDLIRQAAYSQLSGPRRQVVHLQLARALAAIPDAEGLLAGQTAHHAALGGDEELAARASVTAGERSLRMFAYTEAYSLAERALPRIQSLPSLIRIHLRLEFLKIAVHASVAVRDARNFDSEISHAIVEAQQSGLAADVATGFYLLSFRHHQDGNYAAAHGDTLQAVEAGRTGNPSTVARTLGNTGRCLALIEREMPRAESMLIEAQTIAAQAGISLVDVPWGLGLVRAFTGDYDEAVHLLETALTLAEGEQDHWTECGCLQRLTLIELERGNPARARERARKLAVVAAKMGDGSEGPFAAALEALSDLMLGDAGAPARIEEAISVLRHIDAKALLSRALAFVAVLDLEGRDFERAANRAREALAAAEAVGRRSEIVMARAILARAAQASGNAAIAMQQVQRIADDMRDPHAIAAHARRAAGAISGTS